MDKKLKSFANLKQIKNKMKTFDTPIYVFKPLTYEKTKIQLLCVELPFDKDLSYIDMTGQFGEGVLHQVWDSIQSLSRHSNPDLKLEIESEVILLSFIKHYRGSTQTVCICPNSELFEKYSDNLKTNKLFQEAEVVSKYNLQAFLDDKNLIFGVSTQDANTSKWQDLKTKYCVQELE